MTREDTKYATLFLYINANDHYLESLERKYTDAKNSVKGDESLLFDLVRFHDIRKAAYLLREMHGESEGNLRNKIGERLKTLEGK